MASAVEFAGFLQILGSRVDLFEDFHGLARFVAVDGQFQSAVGAFQCLGAEEFVYCCGDELSALGAFQSGCLLCHISVLCLDMNVCR